MRWSFALDQYGSSFIQRSDRRRYCRLMGSSSPGLVKMIVGLGARLAYALLLSFLLAGTATAQRKEVQVQFQIADPSFRSELGNEVTAAEMTFLKLSIVELQKKVGFLQFVATPKPDRLLIQLGDSHPRPGTPIPFSLTLASADSSPSVRGTFRTSAERTNALSVRHDVRDKIRDPELVGGGGQPGEFQRKFSLISLERLLSVFNKIVVAQNAVIQEGPPDPLWEFPFTRGDTCMDLASILLVKHRLDKDSGQSEQVPIEVEALGPDGPDAMHGRIQGRVPNTPDQSRLIGRLATKPGIRIVVESVSIVDYRPYDCNPVVPPGNSGLGGPNQP